MALIPDDRLTDWTPGTRTGVPGGIPTDRTNIINVTLAPYFADNTGATDASTAIQAAIDAAAAQDIIYLPTGNYKFDATVNLSASRDNLTIRGDGPDDTLIIPQTGASAFGWGPSGWNWPSPPATVTSGLTKDSTSITLDDATEFPIGALVRISFDDMVDDSDITAGEPPVFGVGGTDPNDGLRKQVTRVTNKVGNVLTISPAIYMAVPTGLGARIAVAQSQINFTGVEDLSINMVDTAGVHPLRIQLGYGCWVKNVQITNISNYGVTLYDSLQCEVRQCYLGERKLGGSNGAAILFNTSCGCLIEDNICYDAFPCLEVNAGSCGNVFGYNVFENPEGEFGILFTADTNHGPCNAQNLYEGNITPNFICDGYFGSCLADTLFRNWMHGSLADSSATTFTLSLKRFTRNYSMCGNVVGKDNVAQGFFSYGQPNIGNGDYTGEAEPTNGVFWADWGATGVLDTRAGDYAGTFTLSGGSFFVGQLGTIRWGGGSNYQTFTVTDVTGSSISWTTGSGVVLPAVSTALQVFMQPAGYQELDLDVENSTIDKGNYLYAVAGAPGSMSSLGGDTLPDSLYTTEAGLIARGVSPAVFPSFDPEAPDDSDYNNTPAGARFLLNVPDTPPDIFTPCTISGTGVEGQTLTAVPGSVSGFPAPTRTWKWQRDGVDIIGATSITFLLTGSDVGHDVGPVQIETNTEGSDQSVATPLSILAFTGDDLTVAQVANAAPVTELWLRAPLTNGVAGTFVYHLVQHSGPYPTQPVNNFAYKRFGTPQDHIYVFQGTISEAEAIASVP